MLLSLGGVRPLAPGVEVGSLKYAELRLRAAVSVSTSGSRSLEQC